MTPEQEQLYIDALSPYDQHMTGEALPVAIRILASLASLHMTGQLEAMPGIEMGLHHFMAHVGDMLADDTPSGNRVN